MRVWLYGIYAQVRNDLMFWSKLGMVKVASCSQHGEASYIPLAPFRSLE